MPRPVLAILTDFGLRDHYVAAMKAVALAICPDLQIVDITHEIPPQDVAAGAIELQAVYRYFPAGSVFLAVVDPGVGSSRAALAARAGDYAFLGPDNGVLSLALDELGPDVRVVELKEAAFARPVVSRTFEGRDRFAPAAAHLAAGVDLDRLGPRVTPRARFMLPQPDVRTDRIEGEVVRVDRFGTLVTNIPAGLAEGGGAVTIAGRTVPLVATYADVPALALCAMVGSTGFLEIAMNGGNAAAALNAARGTTVSVTLA